MNNQDLFYQADNAVETKPTYETWGQAFVEMFEAVWPKGSSAAERFDETIHNEKDKFIRIEIAIVPLDEMNAKFNTEFKGNVTGWNNKDWAAVVLPSIKALGISARDIHGKFVKIAKKPNGKFYDKKRDGVKTGERGELTDFLFVKVFASQDECLADYVATKAGDPVSTLSDADFPALDGHNLVIDKIGELINETAKATQTAPGNDILLKFARALVTAAAKDNKDLTAVTEKVRLQLDANPMMKGKFTADSPEVLTMIVEACQ